MSPGALGDLLAPFNALLNFTSLMLLLAGFRYIRKKKTLQHQRAMLGAVSASALFLVFYLLRYSLTGTHRFAGEGLAKAAYLIVLFSHMVLAAVIVPLILALLYLAWRGRLETHAYLARWTLPLWIYVSASGLAVYFLLYHVYGYL